MAVDEVHSEKRSSKIDEDVDFTYFDKIVRRETFILFLVAGEKFSARCSFGREFVMPEM